MSNPKSWLALPVSVSLCLALFTGCSEPDSGEDESPHVSPEFFGMLFAVDPALSLPIGSQEIPTNSGRVELWADVVTDLQGSASYEVMVFVGYDLVALDVDGPDLLESGHNDLHISWDHDPTLGTDVRIAIRLFDEPLSGGQPTTYLARGVLAHDARTSTTCDSLNPTITSNSLGFKGAAISTKGELSLPMSLDFGSDLSFAVAPELDEKTAIAVLTHKELAGDRSTQRVSCATVSGLSSETLHWFELEYSEPGEYQVFVFPIGDSSFGEERFLLGGMVSNRVIVS
jgi:hypothetical protein